MAHRLLIVGAVALLVAGVGGAVIFLGDSQLETVKSTPVAGSASGAGVESEPTSPRPARSLPSEPPELSRLPAAPAAEDSIDAKTAPLGPVVKPDAAPATVAAVDAKSTTADSVAEPKAVPATEALVEPKAMPREPVAKPEAAPAAETPVEPRATPAEPVAKPAAAPAVETSVEAKAPPVPGPAPAAETPVDAKTTPLGPVVKPDAAPATEAAVDAKSTTAEPVAEPKAAPATEALVEPNATPAETVAKPAAAPATEVPVDAKTPPPEPVAKPGPAPAAKTPVEAKTTPPAPVVDPNASPAAGALIEAKAAVEPVAKPEAAPAAKSPADITARPAEPSSGAGTGAASAPVGKLGADQDQFAAMAPLHAPQALLAIDDAKVGHDYAADLPPFSALSGARGLALHVEPDPPEGLSFVDLGSGFGRISGKPTKPGQFVFDVVATNDFGGAVRMTTRITVAPAPPETGPPPPKSDAKPQVAAVEPTDKAANFLRGFDGGPCFLARVRPSAGASIAIEGVGGDKDAFRRFYDSFIHSVGLEPIFTVRLIAPPQCPAVSLIAAAQSNRTEAPTLELAAYDLPRGAPLAGSIGALAGRHVDLLMIANDGVVHKIEGRGLAGDKSANFSLPITPDAGSIGALQILVAVASPKPLAALATFHSGPAADILPKVAAQLASSGAAVEFQYFKFLK